MPYLKRIHILTSKVRFKVNGCANSSVKKIELLFSSAVEKNSCLGGLNDHIKGYTKENLFRCSFCAKSFSKKSHWQNHLVVHTKEKTFNVHHVKNLFPDQNCIRRRNRHAVFIVPRPLVIHIIWKFILKLTVRINHSTLLSVVWRSFTQLCQKNISEFILVKNHLVVLNSPRALHNLNPSATSEDS